LGRVRAWVRVRVRVRVRVGVGVRGKVRVRAEEGAKLLRLLALRGLFLLCCLVGVGEGRG
jgi:hypothetical protein